MNFSFRAASLAMAMSLLLSMVASGWQASAQKTYLWDDPVGIPNPTDTALTYEIGIEQGTDCELVHAQYFRDSVATTVIDAY